MPDGTYQKLDNATVAMYTLKTELVLPGTFGDMFENIEHRQQLERIMYLIVAMLQNGVSFYEISERLVNPSVGE